MKVQAINDAGLDESIAIELSDLSFGNPIGQGGFGEVLIGTWSHTRVYQKTVAIKRLLAKELSANVLSEFKNEVAVHVELKHPNIVKMYGITIVQPYCMVMEFMSNGSLFSYLQKTPQAEMKWDTRLTIAEGIVSGIAYLHGRNRPIIHGDLKSLNVLLDKNYTAKIGDFGMSQLKLETASAMLSTTSGQSGKGSLLWMAPELFERRAKKTLQSDVYALGWTLWELAAHKYPFYEDHDKGSDVIKGYIKDNEREEFPDGTPQGYRILIEACWDGAIVKRPTAVAALEAITALIKPSVGASPENDVKPSAVAPMTSSKYMLESSSSPVLTKAAPKTPAPTPPPRQSNSSSTSPYMLETASSQSPKTSSWTKAAVNSKVSTAVKPSAPPLSASIEKEPNLRAESLTTSVPTQPKSDKESDLGNRYQKFDSSEDLDQKSSNSHVKILSQLKAIAAAPAAVKILSFTPKSNAEKCFFEGEAASVRDDYQKALKSYEDAANMGYPPAYVMLAKLCSNYCHVNDKMDTKLWLEKLPVPQKWLNKIIGSVQWFNEKIEQGDPIALYTFATACLYGYGVPKDERLGMDYLMKAASKGYPAAIYHITSSHDASMEEEDRRQFFNLNLSLAENGHSAAQLLVGACYLSGYGVPQDNSKVTYWYFKSCEQNYAKAFSAVAKGYELGMPELPKNPNNAIKSYVTAGELGDSVALVRLGDIYQHGELGVKRDYKKSVEYYQRASELGNHDALRKLALCYKSGTGVKQCDLTAAKFFRLAALSGNEASVPDWMHHIELLSDARKIEHYGKNIPDLSDVAQVCGLTNFKINKIPSDLKKNVMLLSEFIVKGVFFTFDKELEKEYLTKLSISDREKFLTLKEIIRFIDPNKNKLVNKYSPEYSVFAELFLKLCQGKNAPETLKMLLTVFSSCKEGRDSIIRGLKSDRLTSRTFTTKDGNSVNIYEYLSLLNDEVLSKQHQSSFRMK